MLVRQVFIPLVLVTAMGNSSASSVAEWTEAAFNHHANTEVAASERAFGDALQLKSSQWLADDPRVDIKYQTDTLGSDNGYREWESGVELPLWWPGQSQRYQQEAERSVSLAESMLLAKRLQAAEQVRLRMWDVELAEAERDQAKLSLKNARDLLRDVSRRVKAGELPRSNAILAEKNVLDEEDMLLQAENLLVQKQKRFRTYTGLQKNRVAIAETLADDMQITDQHPLLRLAQQHVDKATAHRNRVRGERNQGPNIWLGAKSARAISGADYDESVGIQFSMPIGSKAHAAPAEAEAEQQLAQAMVEYRHRFHELEEALDEALLERDRTATAYEYAQRREQLAGQSLKLNQRAFELGETDLVRLLIAQTDANDSRQRVIQTRLQRDRAIALLNQALGVMPQ